MASVAKSTPKDAQVMSAILKDMGVTDHEPRVINQMLEFAYKYVTDILDDAKVYSNHANKKLIDADDVRLAVQCRLDHSFTSPPPRDLLLEVAKHKNNSQLPLIKPYTGPKLPPDRYCLSAPNFKLRSMKKARYQTSSGPTLIQPSSGTATPRINLTSAQMALLARGSTSQPSVTIRQSSSTESSSTPMPIIRLTTGSLQTSKPSSEQAPVKRKHEEDEDYDKL